MDFSTLLTIFGYAGWGIAGVFGIIGLFDRSARARRQEDDATASNLITNLRTTTDLQEKEIGVLRAKEIEQGKEIAHLQGQVKTLSEIMQGRDPSMQSFFKEAPELLVMVKENNQSAKESAAAIVSLTNALTKLVITMTPSEAKGPM
jgi:uncharacterized coiled-coil protein SlyX